MNIFSISVAEYELRTNKPLVGIRVIKLSNGSTECYVDQNLKQFTLDGEILLDTGKKLFIKNSCSQRKGIV